MPLTVAVKGNDLASGIEFKGEPVAPGTKPIVRPAENGTVV